MTVWLRAALGRIGRRGAFLFFLALLDMIIAYSLTQPLPLGLSYRTVYGPMVEMFPIGLWAVWWGGTGALCAAAVLVLRARVAAFGFAALVKTAWAMCYLIGWIEGLMLYRRGYQSAVIFFAFAGVVLLVSGWRENGR